MTAVWKIKNWEETFRSDDTFFSCLQMIHDRDKAKKTKMKIQEDAKNDAKNEAELNPK